MDTIDTAQLTEASIRLAADHPELDLVDLMALTTGEPIGHPAELEGE